jgi:hypothetical protein
VGKKSVQRFPSELQEPNPVVHGKSDKQDEIKLDTYLISDTLKMIDLKVK